MLEGTIHELAHKVPPSFSSILAPLLLLGVLVLRLKKYVEHVYDSPKMPHTVGFPSVFGGWINSIYYMFSASKMLQTGYDEGNKKPFTIATPENYHVVLSSEKHVAELLSAPQEILSFHAIVTDLFRPKYTMGGMELNDDPKMNEPNVHNRVLRVLLPMFAPTLQSGLAETISESIQQEMMINTTCDTGWTSIAAYPMMQRLITKLNSLVFVGEPLASNPEYLHAALQFPMDVFVTSEIIRLLPSFLSQPVAYLMTRGSRNLKIIRHHLFDLVEERRSHDPSADQSQKPLDCVQWLLDTLPKKDPWPTEKIVSKICALWFGSVHILAMTLAYALYDICTYTAYIEPLRKELAVFKIATQYESPTERYRALCRLPLIDSFLKESARLHPATTIGVRRKAVTSYTFSDGTYVSAGNWVCVPQQAIQRDQQYYPEPELFDGFRFVIKDSDSGTKPKSFTDAEFSFPFWGLGKSACPGRYHSSFIMKLIIADMLLKYDIKFADEKASRSMNWGSVNVPRDGTRILFRRRENDTK